MNINYYFMLRTHILINLLLISIFNTFSVNTSSTLKFSHYSIDDGIPSNIVKSIIQTKDGFVWIGTESGLCRFDGNKFKLFSDESLLDNDYINYLFEDSKDTIWVGTDIGAYCYSYKNSKFIPFEIKTSNGIKINSQINSINEDNEGNIWFSTFGQGVFKYNSELKELENFEFSETSGLINQIYIDNTNTIWVVSRHNDNFLYKYNKLLNCFQQFNTSYEKGADKNGFLCILQESSQYIWLGTWNNGLQKLNIQTGSISQVIPNHTPYHLSHIHSLTNYSDNVLLIGSDDGLSCYNKITGDYQLITPDETEPYSISDKSIYPMTKDKEGGIWVGRYYGGVN